MKHLAILIAMLTCVVSPARGDDVADWWKDYATNTRLVTLPDGKQLSLLCKGEGSPVVMMEAGLGYVGMISWRKVQPAVGRVTTACAYDRAGIGKSGVTDGPRDAGAEADDLAALLQAADLPPPYVIVAHSYGGVIARLYAGRNTGDVAGLVLVDPSSAYQSARFAEAIPAMANDAETMVARATVCAVAPRPADVVTQCQQLPLADLPPTMVEDWSKLFDPIHASHVERESVAIHTLSSDLLSQEKKSLGAMPVVLLNRDPSRLAPERSVEEGIVAERLWLQLHMETMDISTDSQLHIVPGADHIIQNNRPDAIINVITDMVQKIRGR